MNTIILVMVLGCLILFTGCEKTDEKDTPISEESIDESVVPGTKDIEEVDVVVEEKVPEIDKEVREEE